MLTRMVGSIIAHLVYGLVNGAIVNEKKPTLSLAFAEEYSIIKSDVILSHG